MSFSPEQIAALEAKLDPRNVKARAQAGRQVHYVEGWHAIAEANRIFGFDAWDRETVELRQLGDAREVEGKWRVAYMARVRVTVRPCGDDVVALGEAIVRDGCGYGSGIDRDLGSAHESALKEAETDAMKRALMTFGNPFGLALYDKTRENVGAPEPEAGPPAPDPINAAEDILDVRWIQDALARVKSPENYAALVNLSGFIARHERLSPVARRQIDNDLRAMRTKLGMKSDPSDIRAAG